MSHTAGIEFLIGKKLDSLKLVQSLVDSGWSYDDYGMITYLPLDDNDKFDWKRANLAEYLKVAEVIEKKIKKSEVVGIVLTWKNTGIGGEFLFYQENGFLISLSSNRKTLAACYDYTDISWYIKRLIPPVIKAGYRIESVNWKEDI